MNWRAMPRRSPHPRPPAVLIVDDQEWSARSLDSVLSPAGYAVMRAYTGLKGLEWARAQQPDLVFINSNLPDRPGIDLCRTMRDDPELGASIPILMLGAGRPTRDVRLAALEAGAWDVLSYPLDTQVLLLKIDAYVRAKLEVDRIQRESLVDRATGLYSIRGLQRRAHELRSVAHRNQLALACVVLAPASAYESPANEDSVADDVLRLAQGLKATARSSDAVGRLGRTEFAIVALATDAVGAKKLAERMAKAVHIAIEPDGRPLNLRAGYDAVRDVSDDPARAQALVPRATRALRTALAAGTDDWIRPFDRRASDPRTGRAEP